MAKSSKVIWPFETLSPSILGATAECDFDCFLRIPLFVFPFRPILIRLIEFLANSFLKDLMEPSSQT